MTLLPVRSDRQATIDIDCAGHCGDADIKPVPEPAITTDRQFGTDEPHELRLGVRGRPRPHVDPETVDGVLVRRGRGMSSAVEVRSGNTLKAARQTKVGAPGVNVTRVVLLRASWTPDPRAAQTRGYLLSRGSLGSSQTRPTSWNRLASNPCKLLCVRGPDPRLPLPRVAVLDGG